MLNFKIKNFLTNIFIRGVGELYYRFKKNQAGYNCNRLNIVYNGKQYSRQFIGFTIVNHLLSLVL